MHRRRPDRRRGPPVGPGRRGRPGATRPSASSTSSTTSGRCRTGPPAVAAEDGDACPGGQQGRQLLAGDVAARIGQVGPPQPGHVLDAQVDVEARTGPVEVDERDVRRRPRVPDGGAPSSASRWASAAARVVAPTPAACPDDAHHRRPARDPRPVHPAPPPRPRRSRPPPTPGPDRPTAARHPPVPPDRGGCTGAGHGWGRHVRRPHPDPNRARTRTPRPRRAPRGPARITTHPAPGPVRPPPVGGARHHGRHALCAERVVVHHRTPGGGGPARPPSASSPRRSSARAASSRRST